MKVGLFAKGLILIGIPLVLQLGTICFFALLYKDATATLNYQLTAVDSILKLLKVVDDMNEIGKGLINTYTSPKLGFGSVFGLIDELNHEVEELKSSGREYPNISKVTKEVADRVTSFNLQMLDGFEVRRNLSGQSVIEDFEEFRKYVAIRLEWLQSQALSPSGSTMKLESGDVIINGIIASIAINIVTATLLWFVIRRGVVMQITRMETNIQRLASNQELLPPLKGNDEVATFDRSFHDIVDGVRSARLERQEYLEIMSSSLRKPLLELDTFITQAQTDAFGVPNAKGEVSLTAASRSLKRLVALLNELIDFDQIERGTMTLSLKVVKPVDLLNDAVESMKTGGHQPQIIVESPQTDKTIVADPDRLVQVLINLLANAIKFSPPDSEIRLSAVVTENGAAVLSVEDQGEGIPEDMKDRIFSRFEQVDQVKDSRNQKGSGLGLFICKTIVEAHGGEIWVESVAGMGSKFSFSIPNSRPGAT